MIKIRKARFVSPVPKLIRQADRPYLLLHFLLYYKDGEMGETSNTP